jgi:hypothetical protein
MGHPEISELASQLVGKLANQLSVDIDLNPQTEKAP